MARSQKLSAEITVGSTLARSVRKNVAFLRSGLHDVGDEVKRLEERQKDLGKQRRVLEAQGRSVDDLDREYAELGRTLDGLRRKQERYSRAVRDSRRVGETFRAAQASITRAAQIGAVAVGAAGAAIFKVASSTAELGDVVAKNARKFGMGVEAYQELRYAAERSGISISTFDSSMTAYVKRLGEAAEGTGQAGDAIEALGLNVETLIEMKPEDSLGLISDRLARIENPSRRAAIASDLFSRAGVGMVNMLGDGSTALEQLRSDARATGYVLSGKAASDAEVFQDRLLDAQLVVKGLKNTFGAELMPVVTDGMVRFSTYARSNRDEIEAFASATVDGLERALPVVGELATGMGRVAGYTGEMVSGAAHLVGGYENLGMVIGGAFAARTVYRVGAFAASVARLAFSAGRVVAGFRGLAPILRTVGAVAKGSGILSAITVIAGGAIRIRQNWEDVEGWFGEVWRGWGELAGGVVGNIGALLRGDLPDAAEQSRRALGAAFDLVRLSFKGLGESMRLVWDTLIAPVLDLFGALEPVERAWSSLRSSVGAALSGLSQKFGEVWPSISTFLEGLGVAETLGGLWSSAVDTIGSALDRLAAKAAAIWERIRPVVEGIESVGGAISRALGSGEDPAPVRSRRMGYANGGSFGRGPILVGERGPELRFEDRAGFIATNRQSRALAAMAEKAGGLGGGSGAAPAAGGGVTQNITVHAGGMSVPELVAELERRRRSAERSALFDPAQGYGQYGGAF